jgi:hypothetical protein
MVLKLLRVLLRSNTIHLGMLYGNHWSHVMMVIPWVFNLVSKVDVSGHRRGGHPNVVILIHTSSLVILGHIHLSWILGIFLVVLIVGIASLNVLLETHLLRSVTWICYVLLLPVWDYAVTISVRRWCFVLIMIMRLLLIVIHLHLRVLLILNKVVLHIIFVFTHPLRRRLNLISL